MFTQRHYWALAEMIKADHATFTYDVAVGMANKLAALNAKFKRDLFMRASGWEHKPGVVAVAA